MGLRFGMRKNLLIGWKANKEGWHLEKISIFLLSMLVLLTSCIPGLNDKDDELLQTEEQPTGQPSIVPTYKLSDEEYSVVLPYRTSKARGVTTHQMADNRLDIDELEQGLMSKIRRNILIRVNFILKKVNIWIVQPYMSGLMN